MGRYTISTHVAAPPEHVFALWTNLERMGEWVGGVTGVSDVSGPVDQVGTTYVVHFGPMKSPTEFLEVERPRLFGGLVMGVLTRIVRGQLPRRA